MSDFWNQEVENKSIELNVPKSLFASKKKYLYFLLTSLIFAILFGFYFGKGDLFKRTKPNESSKFKQEYFLNIDDMNVGINSSSDSKISYIKASLSLHFAEDYELKQAEAKMPLIKDTFQIFFRSLRLSDFNYQASMFKIKEELSKRVNKTLSPIEVKDVLIKEITVN